MPFILVVCEDCQRITCTCETKNTSSNSTRKLSTAHDSGPSSPQGSRRPSIADAPRRSSIASLSLRLTRSKKTPSVRNSTYESKSRLGELFFALPVEIQSQVFAYLEKADFYALRLTSRTVLSILNANASSLVRSLLDRAGPQNNRHYIQSLFDPPTSCRNTNYLLQLLHRQSIIDQMVREAVSFIRMKTYLMNINQRIAHFGPYRTRLVKALQRPAWTMYHFLEHYRNLLVYQHPNHHAPTQTTSNCSQCYQAIENLVNSYPRAEIVPAYHFYHLALLHLRSSTRAPSYAGTIERRLRGWSRKPPQDPDLAQFIILGGIPLMSQISMMRGTYTHRLETIGGFGDDLVSSACRVKPTFPSLVSSGGGGGGGDSNHGDAAGRQASLVGPPSSSSSWRDFMQELDTPFDMITKQTLQSMPPLDDFLFSAWKHRILSEGLLDDELDREEELATPFPFVQRIMAIGVDGDVEDGEFITAASQAAQDESGFDVEDRRTQRESWEVAGLGASGHY